MIFLPCRAVDVFYFLSMDISWRGIWHSKPLDRCQSRSVYEPIGIHELSTFHFEKYILRPSSYIFHQSSCLCTKEDLCLFLVVNLFWFFCFYCLSCDIVEKRSQLEYASVELIWMPPVRSNISRTTELWVINNQFHRFLSLCGCNGHPHDQSCCFLKAKGHPFEGLLKFNLRVCSRKKNLRLEFSHRAFFGSTLLRVSEMGSLLLVRSSLQAPLFLVFPCFFPSFSFYVRSFLWGLFPADGMAESSCCSWDCSRNSDRKMVLAIDLSALEGHDEIRLEIVMGEIALLRTARDGSGRGVCPVTAIAMAAEGHPCNVSTALKPLLDFPPFFSEIVRRAFGPSCATS